VPAVLGNCVGGAAHGLLYFGPRRGLAEGKLGLKLVIALAPVFDDSRQNRPQKETSNRGTHWKPLPHQPGKGFRRRECENQEFAVLLATGSCSAAVRSQSAQSGLTDRIRFLPSKLSWRRELLFLGIVPVKSGHHFGSGPVTEGMKKHLSLMDSMSHSDAFLKYSPLGICSGLRHAQSLLQARPMLDKEDAKKS